MSAIPDEAMTAASEAFAKVYNDPVTMAGCIRAAVEAAAPSIAAAERDRLLNRPVSWIEPDPDQPGYNRGVTSIDAMVARAVAAERERIRQLAADRDAIAWNAPLDANECSRVPFADLIGSGPA